MATVSSVVNFVSPDQANAYLTGFKAGNIMSDYTMGNKNTMSEAQIQAFLKSKNHCNDRDRAKYDRYTAAGYTYNWKDGRFVCMADEIFGANGMPAASGKSAARIIWEASQEFSINPQVLIVLLHKEQGLITDTWPNYRQYQTATGFGCPDTAPCDSQYYGLTNQIRLAAKLFRDVLNGGWSNYPAYSTVYVRYSPDASCGGSNVYIENRATSALYRYTPYQPNAGALAAGTGTAHCGAYGNRNFYNYFTDWFGNTQSSRWSKMLYPRIMAINQNTLKVYADSMELDDSWLNVGQQIMFESKTDLGDGRACLRTRFDTENNNPRCVLLQRLDEFTPQFSMINNDADKLFATTQWTCKVNINNISALCSEPVGENIVVTMAASTDIMGTTYYITKHDWDLGIRDKGIMSERLRTGYNYQVIQQIPMKASSATAKYIPGTDIVKQTISIDLEMLFLSRITINGEYFYRTAHDTGYNSNLVIPGDKLSPNFSAFLFPRNLKTNKATVSRNVLDNQICSNVARDTTLFFDSTIKIGNINHFRTRIDASKDSLCAIDANDLSEV